MGGGMTVPSAFASCFLSVDLTAAKYSGGAGGTFTNDIAGGPSLTVVSATPTFSSMGARTGMNFANAAGESILGEMRGVREWTVVAIISTTSASAMSCVGSANTGAFGWELGTGGARTPYAWTPGLSSGVTASAFASDTAVVVATSFSPKIRKCSVQWNLNTIKTATSGSATAIPAMDYWDFGIGRNRNTYWTGRIAHVSMYARSLHDDDNTRLQALITNLMTTL